MTFKELGVNAQILKALAEAGYETPTPIQQEAIPPALEGRDILGCAQTGTGKTAAFAVPILQKLAGEKRLSGFPPIRSLILTPTRELAIQIYDSFRQYGAYTDLTSALVYGGVSQYPQVESLGAGVDILIATPGRLNDLAGQGYIDLADIKIFVLDEADRMLDMGFIHDVKRIITRMEGKKRQTLFFSATMPREVRALVDTLLTDPVKISVTPESSTVDAIDQTLYFVDKANKKKLLLYLLKEKGIRSVLLFTRTKYAADRVARDLTRANINAKAIHGDKSQSARQSALNDFKDGYIRVLVATDIAARGIDISQLSYVINFDMPNDPENYVHRIGRTGRAGLSGSAVSFCDATEIGYLRDIERVIGKKIPVIEEHPFPMLEAPEQAPAARRGRGGKKTGHAPARAKVQAAPVHAPAPSHTPPHPSGEARRRGKRPGGA